MKLKPVGGRSVPDPARGDLLPKEGRNVEMSTYWLRRMKVGDVTEVKAETKASAKDATKQGGE
ncbi:MULTISPECIES: DUF2635 domain-containing protein [Pantoea]|uniref:DUF2635 domain-containing protein n=1 Tax=Pantoea rodasii TaxID=1076549 RepID=A0A0B1R3G9_9GAMM|nr:MULTISPECIES: DUF2635 domain-containing protein [Pantoea]KHJ65752.1 hypothetical protein QU24_23010 [Pantoea rodasii]